MTQVGLGNLVQAGQPDSGGDPISPANLVR